ncbi:leucyl aminopeptidase family protein [Legionella impletisoli]|uniref:Cytosol aminopeptidase n=1 Tax=Legionella impletisoli TaxID=343510 RepID=A0A917JTA6_9GAMM|nr:leucyl aminopeptidase family protein [Legionella impletisoli]GGI85922.1 cytosol aminopeptidase [Legionella impletisoli]
MQAESFYQTTRQEALPLILITKSQYKERFSELPENVKHAMDSQQFKGHLGHVAVIPNEHGKADKIFIGSGNGEEVQAVAQSVNRLPGGTYYFENNLPQPALIIWSLAQYRFDRYKKNREEQTRVLALQEEALNEVLLEAKAVFYVRDLINTPANDLGPANLAKALFNLANRYDAEFEQWVGDDLLQHNYPAIHAVGRAAKEEPRLLSLTWGDEKHPLVVLIGKGVCFDSGGLDVKPSNAMRLMKKDMGGAAQAMGLAQWIMSKQLPIHLHVLIPAVENAISGDSFRPGDVLTMRNGITVEVDNTDAEGRLILADAMVKASEQKPELLIDFATLTGAARVAVGTEISAMFTADDELAEKIIKAAKKANDPVWRLPLFQGYQSMLDSSVADLVNASSSPYASAITAALFLQAFVPNDIPWVHFDIMAWNVSSKPGKPEGGEAMAMKAIAYYLAERYG